MTIDMKDQVRRYAEHVDSMVPTWTVDEIVSAEIEAADPVAARRRWKPVAVAATAFVAILVAIGAVSSLLLVGDAPDVVDEPSTPSTTISTTTATASPASTTTVATENPTQPTSTTLPDAQLATPAGTWAPFSFDDSNIWGWAQRVAYKPGIGYVAVAPFNDDNQGAAVYVSDDGRDWDSVESSLKVLDSPDMVETPEGLFTAGLSCRGPDRADCRPTMWSSRDGRNWTERAVDPTVFLDCIGVRPIGACGLQVTVGGDESGLLAAGFDRGAMATGPYEGEGAATLAMIVWRSDDGVTWERRSEVDLTNPDVSHVVKVPDGWLIFGAAYYGDEDGLYTRARLLYSSDDGAKWDPINTGETFEESWINDVAIGAQGIVAVGNAGECGRPTAWHSTDGIDWTRISLGPEGSHCAFPTVSVTSFGDGYLAGTANGLVWWSHDGLTWVESEVDGMEGVTWMDLASDGVTIVGIGYVDGEVGPFGVWVWTPDE